jgi:acyl-CoA thioester hydrolase
VFNAHYLVWADEAVNTWWSERGVPWAELNARGVEYLVVASTLEWRSSARWGDTVDVDADLEKLGRTSATVRFTVRVGERECCVVRTTYVCTVDGAPTPWPDDVRDRLTDG